MFRLSATPFTTTTTTKTTHAGHLRVEVDRNAVGLLSSNEKWSLQIHFDHIVHSLDPLCINRVLVAKMEGVHKCSNIRILK